MSPNGAFGFLCLITAGLFSPGGDLVPLSIATLISINALVAGWPSAITALRKASYLTIPLFAFLYLVWVVIVQSSPHSVFFISETIDLTPVAYVIGVASRVFLFCLLAFSLVERFASLGTLGFVVRLALPRAGKILLLTTLSLRNTILQAAARAYTSLIAANILRPGFSLRNAMSGWRLFRAIWVSTLAIAIERFDTKWRFERLPQSAPLTPNADFSVFNGIDYVWFSSAVAAFLLN